MRARSDEPDSTEALLEGGALPTAEAKPRGLSLKYRLVAVALCVAFVALSLAGWFLTPSKPPPPPSASSADLGVVLAKAARRALGGGFSGAVAGVIQVLTLMWLRTIMNYQYRYGTSTTEAFQTLWSEGGVRRLYQGWQYALFVSPLSRFGDTAANSGVLALLAATQLGQMLPIGMRTALASLAAVLWRVAITPLDTLKTTLQVEGAKGYALLLEKTRLGGASVLWSGALAAAVANFVGNYPWYLTLNALDEALPAAADGAVGAAVARSALMGFCATCVSDTCSNSLRVLKTTRQTASSSLSYAAAAELVIAQDGLGGLFGRGLRTRLITNGIQASLFAVVWKLLEKRLMGAGF